ncbi:hypothetical protein ACIPWF_09295 [Paenarthrobacter sp. NPDC089989]|uniref:hypothetical protein n=2 Tax=unclassified Paenarthrobacter TaxID=2634190 RepID=UPI003807464B
MNNQSFEDELEAGPEGKIRMLNVDLSANVGGDFGATAAQQNAGIHEFNPTGRVVCSPWEGMYLEQAHTFSAGSR